ncbi:MAG: TonB-dependent receptor [Acidobacteriota bacterium]
MQPRFRLIHPLCLLLVATAGMAQTTGRMEGIVRDQSGAVIHEASLTIVETKTASRREMATDERGWYVAAALPPGSYEIEVSHTGFRSQKTTGVTVAAGRDLRIDFSLEIGQTKESVVVMSDTPLVNVTSSDWGGSIERAKLETLPLNGRDMFDLAAQQPGVTVAGTASKNMTNGGGTRLTINGARPNQNSYRMDGIYVNDATGSAPSSSAGRLLGLEAVQEVKLVSSPFDAEYGRAGGAVFTAISKSGANEIHGSAYEFFRNSYLDAKNFFDSKDSKIPPLRRNQFGGVITGPIRRNKLFYMANFESNVERLAQTQTAIVPNADARKGILPDRTVAVSPQAAPYVALYPLPNSRDYGDGTGAFLSQVATSSNEYYGTGKIDYVYSDRLRTALRYTHDDSSTYRGEALQFFTFPLLSHYQFVHSETQFIQSPTTIHTLRAGFSRVANSEDADQPDNIPANLSFVPGQMIGIISFTSGISNFGGPARTNVGTTPRRFIINDYQLNHVVSTIRGLHSLRFGGSYDRVQFNQRADNASRGTYTFASLLDFLQARPRSGEFMLPGADSVRGWRQSIYSAFAQDDIRVSPRFTLTLGLRYEAYSVPSEAHGKISTVPDYLTATGFTVGGSLFTNPSKRNFAPRVSFAWDPFGTGKTIVRAGAGVFYDVLGTRELIIAGVRMPPFFNSTSLTNPVFPNIVAASSSVPANNVDGLGYYLDQPVFYQYQLQIQQKVSSRTVAQIGYVGGRGQHLTGGFGESNPYRPDVLADGTLYFPVGAPRLNPAFTRLKFRQTQFDSTYQGLQTALHHQFEHGLRFQMKYVWGKSLDNTSSTILRDYAGSDSVPNVWNLRANKGRSDFDLQHTFAANFSYIIPGPKAGLGFHILGGWELHGMVQAQTGSAFGPSSGFDRARFSGGGTADQGQRPNYAAAPGATIILGDPQQYFDPNAYVLQPAGTFGNLGRNTLSGPGLATADMALNKTLFRTERQMIRIRLEAFNVTNHPNFQVPSTLGLFSNTGARNGSAGQITETVSSSRQLQLSARWSF